jgi:DJ-1 family protein
MNYLTTRINLPAIQTNKLTALVPLVEGFEEIEAIVPIDVLRRAGFAVSVAGVNGSGPVLASRGTRHIPDMPLSAVLHNHFDVIVLPGGRPGADRLANHEGLRKMLIHQISENLWLGAICAAPLVLDRAGLLQYAQFVCHPAAASEIRSGTLVEGRVAVSGKIVTAIGAGASFEFALRIVNEILGPAAVSELNRGLMCPVCLVQSQPTENLG